MGNLRDIGKLYISESNIGSSQEENMGIKKSAADFAEGEGLIQLPHGNKRLIKNPQGGVGKLKNDFSKKANIRSL